VEGLEKVEGLEIPGNQDLLGRPVLLALLEQQDLQVVLALLDQQDLQVVLALLDQQDLQVVLALLDQQDLQVVLALPVLVEKQGLVEALE
jgi:hypothetical protein